MAASLRSMHSRAGGARSHVLAEVAGPWRVSRAGKAAEVFPRGDDVQGRSTDDSQSPVAVAMVWSARVMTVSLEMVLPTLGGYYLDQRFGTGVLFLVTGGVVGFVAFIAHLLRLAKDIERHHAPDAGRASLGRSGRGGCKEDNE